MESPENLYLKWDDFQRNMCFSYQKLREDTDFNDVTLACEDNTKIEAHRIILSASSPVFQEILGSNKHPHPLIYMKGVKYKYLTSILDFIYHGEVTIHQEDLMNLLELAGELKLKGLTDHKKDETYNEPAKQPLDITDIKEKKITQKMPEAVELSQDQNTILQEQKEMGDAIKIEPNQTKTEYLSDIKSDKTINVIDISGLHSMIMTMLEKGDGTWTCIVCGRVSNKINARQNMMNHVESVHLDTGTHPCDVCDKTFRSRENVRRHKYRAHN